jgi:glycosyltransferase involved in cell wall biosynthesis
VPTLRLVNNLTERDPHELNVYPRVRAAFAGILDELEPDVVHVHHLIHLSADLVEEVKARGIPAVATLHDYWYLCSRVQLYIPGEGVCKGPAVFRCADCIGVENELVHSMRRFAFLGDRAARLWMDTCSHVEWAKEHHWYERRFDRMRKALSLYDAIIANSEHLRRRYIRFGAPAGRIQVMTYGLNHALLRPARHAPTAAVRFGYTGSIVEHKGIHVLLDAFRRVPEASLQIFGDTEVNETVRHYRASMHPPPNVRFMGGFDPRDIGRVLRGIDVLVVPSIWEEAYGMTVDEAKVAGIPVIASRTGGIPEHLKDGKEGFLFAPGDVDGLEHLVRRLAGRPDLVRRLQPKGDDVPTLHENAMDVEAVYRSVAARKRSGIP